MSKTGRINYHRGERGIPRSIERYIEVRSVRREPADVRKLSRAVIAIALREAEAEAHALVVLTGSVEADEAETHPALTAEKPDDTENSNV